MDVNYLIVDPDKWTIKEDNNNLIKLLIQNYVRKYNELYGEYRRKNLDGRNGRFSHE